MKITAAILLILLPLFAFASGLSSGSDAFSISDAVEGVCIDITGGNTVNVDEACAPTWSATHTWVAGKGPILTTGSSNTWSMLGHSTNDNGATIVSANASTTDFQDALTVQGGFAISGGLVFLPQLTTGGLTFRSITVFPNWHVYWDNGNGHSKQMVFDAVYAGQITTLPNANETPIIAIDPGTNQATSGFIDYGYISADNGLIQSDDAGNLEMNTAIFDQATGTPPFTTPSTTKVTNLNCDALDGIDSAAFAQVLSGTSGSIGGGALLAGACATGTVTITGATTSMVAFANPSSNHASLDSCVIKAYVSAADTVTVQVCETVAGTPTAKTYLVRVIK